MKTLSRLALLLLISFAAGNVFAKSLLFFGSASREGKVIGQPSSPNVTFAYVEKGRLSVQTSDYTCNLSPEVIRSIGFSNANSLELALALADEGSVSQRSSFHCVGRVDQVMKTVEATAKSYFLRKQKFAVDNVHYLYKSGSNNHVLYPSAPEVESVTVSNGSIKINTKEIQCNISKPILEKMGYQSAGEFLFSLTTVRLGMLFFCAGDATRNDIGDITEIQADLSSDFQKK